MPSINDLYSEEPEDVFNPNTDLKEAMGNEQPGGGESLSLDGGEATIVYELDSNKRRSFTLWILGFSYTFPLNDPGTPLNRFNPQPHPVFYWLRAHSVTFSGFSPQVVFTREVPIQASPGIKDVSPAQPTLKKQSVFPAFGPNPTPVPAPAISATGINTYQMYLRCYATVKFKAYPYEFIDDADISGTGAEIQRNVFFDVASSVEMLSAENGPIGQLSFNETTPGGPSFTPPIGPIPAFRIPITKAFGTLVSKDIFVLNWMSVPQEFLSVAPYPLFIPKNILDCIGKVNSVDFAGFPAFTLLLQPPKFVRFRWPCMTTQGFGFYGYHIMIPFQHFDPPQTYNNYAANSPLGLLPQHPQSVGYHLLPWAPNLGWYEAVRQDGVTHLLMEEDFNKIFEHVSVDG